MTRRSTFGLFAATLICCSIGVYALDLARYDAMNGMQEMPQDMGKYNWFTCTGGETNRSCKFNQDEVYRYVSGVALYGAANLVGLVIVLLIILLNISCHIYSCFKRFFCCCCKKKVEPAPENGGLPPKKVVDHKAKYSKRDYCRITSFVFVVIMLPLWCILGNVLGIQQLETNSSGIVNAPSGVMEMCVQSEPVATNTLITTVSTTLVPLIEGIDNLVNEAINFDDVIGAAEDFSTDVLLELPQLEKYIAIGYSVANLTTNASAPIIDEILGQMGVLNDTIANITHYNNNLIVAVTDLGVHNHGLSMELGNTSVAVANLRVLVVELVGDGGSSIGAVTNITNDLNAMPPASEFSTAASSVGSMASSNLGSVVADCTTVYTSLATLPNYTQTAAELTLINTDMQAMVASGGNFDQLTWRLNNISALVAAYPSFSAISDVLINLNTTAHSVDIIPLIGYLNDLLDLFDVLPGYLTEVYNEIIHAEGLVGISINITQALTKQIYSVNTTLYALPDSIMDAADYTFGDKFTEEKLLQDFGNYTDLVRDYNDTLVKLLDDSRSAIVNASDFQGKITDTLSTIDITNLVSQLNTATNEMAAINFTQPLSLIASLRSDIAGFTLNASFVTALQGLQTYIETLDPMLQRVVDTTKGGAASNTEGDFIVLSKGYCSGDGTINNCVDNTPCSGAGTCINIGSYRCANNGATSCTVDSDCAGSYCLADSSRINTLQTTLGAYTVVDATAMLGSLGNFQSTVSELDAATTSIASAQSGIDSFDIPQSVQLITDLNDAMTQLDIGSLIDMVKDAQKKMADLKVKSQVDDYAKYQDDQKRVNRDVNESIAEMRAIQQLLVDPNLPLKQAYVNLDQSHLQAVYAAEGPSGVLRYVLMQTDNINNYLADNVNVLFNISRRDNADNKNINDKLDILDKMGGYPQGGYGDMRENGATYYLMRISNSDTVRPWYSKIMGVWYNSDNERYPNNDLCVTESCEDHTLNVIFHDPVSDWSTEVPGAPDVPLDYTMSDIYLMMWIPPLLTAFLGLCTGLLNFKFYYEKTRKCCTFMFMSCVLCQLPFILLLTAMLFPMSIFISDVCTTGPNIGSNYLVSYGDPMCRELNGTGTLRACDFTAYSGKHPSDDVIVTVDILGVYDSVVSGECSGVDPFTTIITSVMDGVNGRVYDRVDKYLDNHQKDLRPPVKNLLRTAATNIDTTIASFFTYFGDGVFNCERVAAVSSGFHDATCGTMVEPFLWMVGSFYLAAWTLVCCAFPAGCLKKRYNMIDEGAEDNELIVVGDTEGGDVEMVEAHHPVAVVPDGHHHHEHEGHHNHHGHDGHHHGHDGGNGSPRGSNHVTPRLDAAVARVSPLPAGVEGGGNNSARSQESHVSANKVAPHNAEGAML